MNLILWPIFGKLMQSVKFLAKFKCSHLELVNTRESNVASYLTLGHFHIIVTIINRNFLRNKIYTEKFVLFIFS